MEKACHLLINRIYTVQGRDGLGVPCWNQLGGLPAHVCGARAMPSFVNMATSTLISENLYNLVHCKSPFAGWAHS